MLRVPFSWGPFTGDFYAIWGNRKGYPSFGLRTWSTWRLSPAGAIWPRASHRTWRRLTGSGCYILLHLVLPLYPSTLNQPPKPPPTPQTCSNLGGLSEAAGSWSNPRGGAACHAGLGLPEAPRSVSGGRLLPRGAGAVLSQGVSVICVNPLKAPPNCGLGLP